MYSWEGGEGYSSPAIHCQFDIFDDISAFYSPLTDWDGSLHTFRPSSGWQRYISSDPEEAPCWLARRPRLSRTP